MWEVGDTADLAYVKRLHPGIHYACRDVLVHAGLGQTYADARVMLEEAVRFMLGDTLNDAHNGPTIPSIWSGGALSNYTGTCVGDFDYTELDVLYEKGFNVLRTDIPGFKGTPVSWGNQFVGLDGRRHLFLDPDETMYHRYQLADALIAVAHEYGALI
jgi:hypothetical protein